MKQQKHVKSYRAAMNGGQTVCSCGWESPVVDESMSFILGRKVKTPDEFFEQHLAVVAACAAPETAMQAPAEEQATAPAQRSQPRRKRA